MQNLQRILVPTDFSDGATNALIYAINLSEYLSLELHILHVESENNQEEKDTDECFEKLKHHYLFKRKSKVSCKTRQGDIFESIVDEITESKIDLVVLGMTRKLGTREMMFGSITAKLIDRPPCAIIAIPANCRVLTLKNIGVAIDNQSVANPPELYVIKYLAEAFKAKMNLFHVIKEKAVVKEDSSEVQESFGTVFRNNIHSYEELEGDNLVQAIKTYTKEHQIDLLVVLHHSIANAHLHKRSVSKQLAFITKLPLLIIPIK